MFVTLQRRFVLWGVLTALAGLMLCFPSFQKDEQHVVTQIYAHGTELLFRGESPYDVTKSVTGGSGALYKYSPVFAVLYRPFELLPRGIRGFVWCVAGLLIFFSALTLILQLYFSQATPLALTLASLIMLRDLDITLRYHQYNVMMLGWCLWGAWFIHREKNTSGSLFMALATLTKAYPAVYWMLWILMKPRLLVSAAIAILVWWGIGSAALGLRFFTQQALAWVPFFLTSPSGAAHPGGLPFFFQAFGLNPFIPVACALPLLVLFCVQVFRKKVAAAPDAFIFFCYWICLFSTVAESPLYILPSLATALLCLHLWKSHRKRAITVASIHFVSSVLMPSLWLWDVTRQHLGPQLLWDWSRLLGAFTCFVIFLKTQNVFRLAPMTRQN